MNGKVIEIFAKIPKLEADGSNWVIFKDRFLFAAAAASLRDHIDGKGAAPKPVTFASSSGLLSAAQQEALDDYAERLSRWQSNDRNSRPSEV